MLNENLQIVVSQGNRDGHKILRMKGPLNMQNVFGFQAAEEHFVPKFDPVDAGGDGMYLLHE